MATVLTPFIIAALLAYLGDPLVSRLVKWHMSRGVASTLVFTVITLLILCLFLLFIPILEDQISILITKIPLLIAWVQDSFLPWLSANFDIKISLDGTQIKNAVVAHWKQTSDVAGKVVSTLTHSTMTIVAIIINLVLIPVVTFYLLRDWPLLVARMKNLVPRKNIDSVSDLLRQCNDVLGAFFRGQFLVMLALGILYSVGLKIIGLDVALLIGVIIAVLSIVPFLGTIIGLVAAITACLFQFHDFMHVVYVLILFAIGHVLENMVLTPWLIGNRVGLHPVAVIFAVLFGGALFGFFGILLAIPVAAVLLVVLKFCHRKYINSDFYNK